MTRVNSYAPWYKMFGNRKIDIAALKFSRYVAALQKRTVWSGMLSSQMHRLQSLVSDRRLFVDYIEFFLVQNQGF